MALQNDPSNQNGQSIESILQSGSAYINRCEVNTDTPYHAHNFVEIAYVARGKGMHRVNGCDHKIEKGNIFLINYDISHKFIVTDEPLLIYNCIFTPSYFNEALSESRNFFDISDRFLLNNLYTNLPTDYIFATAYGSENNHIFNIYERLLQEFRTKQIGYRDIMRGYVIELLVIICRLKLSVDSDKTQKILEALEYIHTHYPEPLSTETIAAVAGYSASHFRRIFKECMGKSINRYMQTVRTEEACRLLKNRDLSVEQVAQAVGYSDMKHFYAVFKSVTGKLPKYFR